MSGRGKHDWHAKAKLWKAREHALPRTVKGPFTAEAIALANARSAMQAQSAAKFYLSWYGPKPRTTAYRQRVSQGVRKRPVTLAKVSYVEGSQ